MTDYEVLATLSEADDRRWRITALAERMCWSSSRLSHHLTRMERRGLVARDPCPTAGRGTVVRLTDEGMATLTSAAPEHVAAVRRYLFDHLDDRDVHARRVVLACGRPPDLSSDRSGPAAVGPLC